MGFKPVIDTAFRKLSARGRRLLNIDGLLLSQLPHAGRLHAKLLSPKKNHHKTPHKPPGDLVTPRKLSNSRCLQTPIYLVLCIFLTHSKAFEHQLVCTHATLSSARPRRLVEHHNHNILGMQLVAVTQDIDAPYSFFKMSFFVAFEFICQCLQKASRSFSNTTTVYLLRNSA